MSRLLLIWAAVAASAAGDGVYRTNIPIDQGYATIEVLTDDLIHVEYGTGRGPSTTRESIRTSPMVMEDRYSGPTELSHEGSVITTAEATFDISWYGCIVMRRKEGGRFLATVCPVTIARDWKGFSVEPSQVQNVYGLGQNFQQLGTADGDWIRHGKFNTNNGFGNSFSGFHGGADPQLQFPMMYALGNNGAFGLFLDNQYKQEWDFVGDSWWQVRMYGDVRFYLMPAADMLSVRKTFMKLTGRPPVPPRKAFGFWMSEFGYDNWNEVDGKLAGLRRDRFPVDGFVLDLQWFGSAQRDSPNSRMGGLEWDTRNFPRPAEKIASYARDHVGIIAIEESYVARNQRSFRAMADRQGLARRCRTSTPIEMRSWMGLTGMVDWSNKGAGRWWHDNLRKENIIDKGVMGHWTDLGEPERYDGGACYTGVGGRTRHSDIHNLYNLLWHESIYDGYVRHHAVNSPRPFLLSRAGAPGIQRFGAAIWSGDIASRLDTLATHLNAAMHMSFVGIDYYGSDTGGFWRRAVWDDTLTSNGWRPSLWEMYMQWFANAAWFDIPFRPHVYNCGFSWERDPGCPHETSPARAGEQFHRRSHLANLRQRYELVPYYYSLAHRAYLFGEPVIAPVVMYYPEDRAVRQMGHQKLIGRDVMVAVVASHGQRTRRVYLPAGDWVNYHTFDVVRSSGDWTRDLQLVGADGVFRLPVFVRSGSILPAMHVDSDTKDVFGNRVGGGRDTRLVVKVFAAPSETSFMLYEDDGETVAAYGEKDRPEYHTRVTEIKQVRETGGVRVVVGSASGTFRGSVNSRSNEFHVVPGRTVRGATLNGSPLTQLRTRAAFDAATEGWFNAGTHVMVRTSVMLVSTEKDLFLSF